MKKVFKILAVALAVIMAAVLFTGCSSKDAAKTDDKAKVEKVKIGLSLPTQREERWVRDKETMEAEAKKLGIDLEVQVSDNDSARQVSQCENLITKGIKVLIIGPHDAKAAAAIVEKAHAAGVKVVSYDRLILDSDPDVYITFDNIKVGELQGKFITEKTPKGNYVVLAGDPSDNNAKLFKEGAMKYIKPLADKGDIKIVLEQACKDWKPDEAMKQTENALTAQKNDIQAVLAPNDGTAGGVIQALAAQGLAGKIPVTGQDSELSAAKRILEGTQSMTIYKDTRELGKVAIATAIKMAKGEPVTTVNKINNGKMDVPAVLLDAVVVDKSNLDKMLIDSGYLKKEDVYGK